MMGDQAEKLRELARRGGQKPPEPEREVEAPTEAPADVPVQERVIAPMPGHAGRTIVVTSGKGGVGKTNVTVNLALAFAKRGRKTILFDADLGMANVDVMMGVHPLHSIADVLKGRKTLIEATTWVSENLGIVPGGSGVAELANLEPAQLEGVVGQLAELEAQAELILVDTGAGISRNVMNFVLAASEILVVTTPEPTAITDAYGMLKEIDAHNPAANVQLLVNMVASEAEARSVASKLVMIVERFLSLKVHYVGCIERDSHVSRSVLQQQPFFVAHPQSTAARRLNILAGTLLAQNEESKPVSSSFFSRLVTQIFRSRE